MQFCIGSKMMEIKTINIKVRAKKKKNTNYLLFVKFQLYIFLLKTNKYTTSSFRTHSVLHIYAEFQLLNNDSPNLCTAIQEDKRIFSDTRITILPPPFLSQANNLPLLKSHRIFPEHPLNFSCTPTLFAEAVRWNLRRNSPHPCLPTSRNPPHQQLYPLNHAVDFLFHHSPIFIYPSIS